MGTRLLNRGLLLLNSGIVKCFDQLIYSKTIFNEKIKFKKNDIFKKQCRIYLSLYFNDLQFQHL